MSTIKDNWRFFAFKYKKNTDTLFEQTQTKPQGKLELVLTKPKNFFSFNIPLSTEDREWMLGFTSLEK